MKLFADSCGNLPKTLLYMDSMFSATCVSSMFSFPTSIFIGKDGTVRRVHTGFNGPGTGDYYTEYVKITDSLVKSSLEE